MEAVKQKIYSKAVKKHKSANNAVMAVLQDIQNEEGYLSEDAIRFVSAELKVPVSRVFAVATFYSAFSLVPQGRNRIQVCLGTACHIKGAENISGRLTRALGVEPGQTTEDRKFSLHKVRCLGCCALAPVVKINEDTYANVSQEQIESVLEKYK